MLSKFHFFASKQDLCNIFNGVEQKFDIKYCITQADQDIGKNEMPKMEFGTIAEIADDFTAAHLIAPSCLITLRTEVIAVYQQRLKGDDIARYCIDHLEKANGVRLRGMAKHKDLTCEFSVQISREYETEFSANLFKNIVREVKQNCVRLKNTATTYIGRELYKEREKLIFSGERCGAFTVTDTNEAKNWYRRPKVRDFADQPFMEKLSFLQSVFNGKELKDFKEDQKNFSEDFEIYGLATGTVWGLEDLSLLKEVFALFDDEVKIPGYYGTKTAMEDLCDASVYVASIQKTEGIRILLEQLHYVPVRGYHCGCEGIIKILLTRKYFNMFKTSLTIVNNDAKLFIKNVMEDLTDKKTIEKRKELIDML